MGTGQEAEALDALLWRAATGCRIALTSPSAMRNVAVNLRTRRFSVQGPGLIDQQRL